jgi:hypothetical protein
MSHKYPNNLLEFLYFVKIIEDAVLPRARCKDGTLCRHLYHWAIGDCTLSRGDFFGNNRPAVDRTDQRFVWFSRLATEARRAF